MSRILVAFVLFTTSLILGLGCDPLPEGCTTQPKLYGDECICIDGAVTRLVRVEFCTD